MSDSDDRKRVYTSNSRGIMTRDIEGCAYGQRLKLAKTAEEEQDI